MITLDSSGRIFVVEGEDESGDGPNDSDFKIYTKNGSYIGAIGIPGWYGISSIGSDPWDNIYVFDTNQIFKFKGFSNDK